MFKKYMSPALICLLLNFAFYSTAVADTQKEAKLAEKIKTNITKRGAGKDVNVKIKLKDGTKLKGCVSEIKDSSFIVVNDETGKDSEIQYLQVKEVKEQNLSKGEKILVRSSIIIGAIFLYGFYLSRSSDY